MQIDFSIYAKYRNMGKIRELGAVAELADAVDLKSTDRKVLRVQVPPAPLEGMGVQK